MSKKGGSSVPDAQEGQDGEKLSELLSQQSEKSYSGSSGADSEHPNYRYVCPYCLRGYWRRNFFNQHLAKHGHGDVSEQEKKQVFTCPDCNAVFQTQQQLDAHACSTKNVVLDANLQIYNDCQCDVCGKFFSSKYHLETHMLIHKGVRNSRCHICGKTFIREDVLLKHIRNVHEKDNKFQCEICQMRFSTNYHLKRHMNTHLDKTECICTQCGKKFDRIDKYNNHVKKEHLLK